MPGEPISAGEVEARTTTHERRLLLQRIAAQGDTPIRVSHHLMERLSEDATGRRWMDLSEVPREVDALALEVIIYAANARLHLSEQGDGGSGG